MLPDLGAGSVFQYGVSGSHWAAGYHTGRDYQCGSGSRIVATRGGKVVHTGRYGGWGQDYGIHVIIQTGSVRHLYAHLSRVAVRKGETVREGQVIGRSGATGNVTGAHLHYEERTSPYSYWDHRRPVFDTSSGVPVLSLAKFRDAYKKGRKHPLGSLYKRELKAALKARGRPVAPMNLRGNTLGIGTKINTRRLRGTWYGDYDNSTPGPRLLKRLGSRRNAWRLTR